jgi:hypothetical protein
MTRARNPARKSYLQRRRRDSRRRPQPVKRDRPRSPNSGRNSLNKKDSNYTARIDTVSLVFYLLLRVQHL